MRGSVLVENRKRIPKGMVMTSKVVAGVGVALLAFTVAASAQTLGDLAKQEEARRKEVKSPGKVYTNDSLHSAPAPSTPPAGTPASATADKAAGDKTGAQTGDQAAADKSGAADNKTDVKDQTYWTKRMTDARNALERSQSFAEALQTRINSLTTDFTNRDDPAQRSQIAADRDKALAQLTQLKKEIEQNTKAIADIQDDARKAGVPAGWVR
jgi:hypothetical protein